MATSKNKKGFTLIEVIVTTIVLTLIAAVGITSISVLSRSSQMSHQRSMAVNLLQKSQEEVRRVAQTLTFFDNLETCAFPISEDEENTCGFETVTEDFPGFTRVLTVLPQGAGGTDLKRVHIKVEWEQFGKTHQLDSLTFLSKPPEPVPGNLVGFVADFDDPNIPLNGVNISLVHQTTGEEKIVTSRNTVNDSKGSAGLGANYDFAAPPLFDRYLLDVGTWEVTATHPDYLDFPEDGQVITVDIQTASERTFDFKMERKPEDAKLTVNLVNPVDGSPVTLTNDSNIWIYENGARLESNSNSSTLTRFFPFEGDEEERFLTVRTNDADESGFMGNFSCNASLTGYREGWTSSIARDENNPPTTLVCSNPLSGNQDADRIKIQSGDEVVVNVPLVRIPEATIQGRVTDSNGSPVVGADIIVRWPNGVRWINSPFNNATDAAGNYAITVPAAQVLHPNNISDYLQVNALGAVSVRQCCNIVSTIDRASPVSRVGPLFAGNVVTQDFVIPTNDFTCGNVEGNVRNDKTSGSISGVDVRVSGQEFTNGAGDYVFECDVPNQDYFSIRTGNYRFRAFKSGYYANDTNGNDWYTQKSGGQPITILNEQVSDYNARMWPRGEGDIKVIVRDKVSGAPVKDVNVQFDPYFGATLNRTTNTSGEVDYNNAPETWPPPGLPTDGYYKTNTRNHSIRVNPDTGVYFPQSKTISNFVNDEERTVVFELLRAGGV